MALLIRVVVVSILLLIPCFWRRSIHAGDLGSHIYNSWLAQQIEDGKAPGLTLVPITTNVLFDLVLGWLFRCFGPAPAQRIAVSLAVLIFFWGAFALVRAMSGRRPWYLAPCLAMLAYGWAFHMGFFNFYLATGLSLWALALSFTPGFFARMVAAVLLAAAYFGHALPPAWAVAVIAYAGTARSLALRPRLILLASAIGAVAGASYWVTSRYRTFSSFHQILEAGAVDQVWVFGLKYCAISIGLALLWSFLLLGVTHVKGIAGTAGGISFQLCLVMALGIVLFPTRIELPQYGMALSFITERMTLPYGVLICAFLAAADPPKWLRIAFVPLALIYFSFLYVDTKAAGEVERSMEKLTAGLSTNDRVFTSLDDPLSRVQLWSHMLDRVCLGRCISYANYEPFSRQFRIRMSGPNPLAVSNSRDYGALNDGGYTVKQSDLPFYQIVVCGGSAQELCLKRLEPGEVTKNGQLSVAPRLWW